MPVAATLVGVIAPKVNVIAGVVVGVATVPLIPLAVTTEVDVTVPEPAGELHPNIPLPFVVRYCPAWPVCVGRPLLAAVILPYASTVILAVV